MLPPRFTSCAHEYPMSKRAPRDLSELPLSQPRYLGKDTARIEDATLLTGRAEFGDNVAFPGMLFAAILRSPHAHARIKRIDTSKAEKLAGVVAVVTGEDAKVWSEPVHGFPIGWAGHCLAHDKVRFVGDPVAAVAATSRYIAEDALELIEVDYEILAPVIDAQKALDPDSPVIWQHQGTNLIYHRVFTFGAVDEAFAKADVVVRDDFRWLRASGNPIETCNCIVQWRPDHSLNAWGGFQGTGFYVASVARGLRMPAHKIRITPLPHGGSFGTKIFPHAIVRMALLSRKAGGRHVKWIEDRVEHLLSSYTHGPDRIYSAEMALKRDGEITGFRVKVLDDLGAHAVSVAIGKALKPLSAFTGPGVCRRTIWRWNAASIWRRANWGSTRSKFAVVIYFVLNNFPTRPPTARVTTAATTSALWTWRWRWPAIGRCAKNKPARAPRDGWWVSASTPVSSSAPWQ
jgi:CO/xanthine dehydrogenase Mo-binding subunit